MTLKEKLEKFRKSAKMKIAPTDYFSPEFWCTFYNLEKIVDEIDSLNVGI